MAPFAAKREGIPHLGEIYPARRSFLFANSDTAPATLSLLRRQNPREEPGAFAAPAGSVRGRGAILIPTATIDAVAFSAAILL